MMNRTELLNLVDNLHEKPTRGLDDHVLILDGLNTLIRSFSVNVTLNKDGVHVGGLIGFLKSLGSMTRMFNPTRVIVVWDGIGGAQNRKNIDENYKANRAHASVIHYDMYQDKKAELDSMQDQADRLVDYIACLPVTYIQIDKLEADDVIAYLAKLYSKVNRRVTIVSSDRDFLQLVDQNVEIYSPIKRVLYVGDGYSQEAPENCEVMQASEYLQVLPENYNIVKTILGDGSDGLVGIKGVGIKGLVKEIPELTYNPDLTLDKFFDICAERRDTKHKSIFTKILAGWHIIEKNYQLMDLNETVLDENEKNLVHEILRKSDPKLRIGPFLHYLEEDKIEQFMKDTEGWLCEFSKLTQ